MSRDKPKLSTIGRRRAAVILEVLGGARSVAEAATALDLSVTRYYALEATALGGLSAACEPLPNGKKAEDLAKRIDRLEGEKGRLEAENARLMALLRSLQRTVGVKPQPSAKAKQGQKSKRRRRKTKVRALVAAERLQPEEPPEPAPGKDKNVETTAAAG